jgi:hypothetical protein
MRKKPNASNKIILRSTLALVDDAYVEKKSRIFID